MFLSCFSSSSRVCCPVCGCSPEDDYIEQAPLTHLEQHVIPHLYVHVRPVCNSVALLMNVCVYDLYIYRQPVLITQKLELLSESHNLVYVLTCIPAMKCGQWQALKVIGTYSDCANKAVIERHHVPRVGVFWGFLSLLLFLHLSNRPCCTGQERRQSALMILVMISLQLVIASHALFNKDMFEVLSRELRQSFLSLQAESKGREQIKSRRHLFKLSTCQKEES